MSKSKTFDITLQEIKQLEHFIRDSAIESRVLSMTLQSGQTIELNIRASSSVGRAADS